MKKIFGIVAFICIIVLVGYLLVMKLGGASDLQGGSQATDSYQELRGRCNNDSCCLASVDAMKQIHAIVEPESGCAAGYRGNMLKCIESYRWCERIEDSATSAVNN